MSSKKSYTGINIQFPISRLILDGNKTIETRTYPIPRHYIGQEMVVIETPGKEGKFKARMVGIIVFGESFQYTNEKSFYKDQLKHCVAPDSIWKWNENNEKWGWPIQSVRRFKAPLQLQKRSGIKFSKGIFL